MIVEWGWSGKVPGCGCLLEWVSAADPDYLTRRLEAWRAMGYEPIRVTATDFESQVSRAGACTHSAALHDLEIAVLDHAGATESLALARTRLRKLIMESGLADSRPEGK